MLSFIDFLKHFTVHKASFTLINAHNCTLQMPGGEKSLTSCCKSTMKANDYHHTLNWVIADYNHILRTGRSLTSQKEDSQLLEIKSPKTRHRIRRGLSAGLLPPGVRSWSWAGGTSQCRDSPIPAHLQSALPALGGQGLPKTGVINSVFNFPSWTTLFTC